jgi:SNF family Na+-dependent transporter
MADQGNRARWGTRVGFILAAAGSAIGLGNIWKFPYICGMNGGGLFVLIYLFCIAMVGIPIMMAEIMIGRAAQKQPVAAFHALQGQRTGWAAVGWMGVVAGFVILSYYIVVAGWTMDYTLKSIANYTEPIHERAVAEATAYRANTKVQDMREALIARKAERQAKPGLDLVRREVPPSVWQGYERFNAALKAAGGGQRAEQALLEDALLADQVRRARELEPAMQEVREEARAAAVAHYRELSDAAVRTEAETVKRRSLIYEGVQAAFLALATDGWTVSFWAILFMLLCILIVAGGIASGIERTCRILMPILFVLILVMVAYGAFKPGFKEAVAFVFKPDIHKLQPSGVLEALGHAFFTLSLGMGAMITYGSYQASKKGLVGESVAIAVLDTLIALLACLMIFPIVFSYGQEAGAGPGLVFMSMPLAFAEIGRGGMLISVVFFALVTLAALTSAISLLEVVVSYFIDERRWSRVRASWILGGAILAFGIPSAFSLDPKFAMEGWEPGYGKNFFDTMDYLASNWLLPLGGLFIALYAGWIMPRKYQEAEFEGSGKAIFGTWLFLVRFVAPLLVVLVLLQKGGFVDADEIFHALLR